MKNKKNEIHIAQGDSSAGTIKCALNLNPADLLINIDTMSYGPLCDFSDINEWRTLRESFFYPIYSYLYDYPFEEYENDILLNTDKIKKADKVTLWIGTCLNEQILLVWIVQLFKIISADIEKLQVIQFFKEPDNTYEIISVGVLNPEQLIKHPSPRSPGKDEISYINNVWSALTSSKPNELIELINDKSQTPLNLMKRSLKFLMGRFPDYKSGLNNWDNQLLKYTNAKGTNAARIIGYTMGYSMENLDWIGDIILLHRLRRLGDESLIKQAVTITGTSTRMHDTEAHLTDFGEKVLNGEANLTEINGIDEWIGGIHLQSNTNNIWYRKDDAIF